MIREFRRAVRGWIREATAVWLRVTAFYRVALGIALSIGIAWVARTYVLDPLQERRDEAREALKTGEVPEKIPTHESDEEILRHQLRAESITKTLAEKREEVRRAATTGVRRPDIPEAKAVAVIDAFAAKCGLSVQSRKREESEEKTAVPVTRYTYMLLGVFDGARAFLKELEDSPHLWRLGKFSLSLRKDETGRVLVTTRGEPVVELGFEMELFHYEL